MNQSERTEKVYAASLVDECCTSDRSMRLDFWESEIDKVGDYWIVKYFRDARAILQLKIRQYTYEFPAELTCEILEPGGDTCVAAPPFYFDVFQLCDEVEVTPCVCVFPEAWRREFVAMAHHWANLLLQTQFMPSPVVWKEGEGPTFVDSPMIESDTNNRRR
jgi:hypothetical protein